MAALTLILYVLIFYTSQFTEELDNNLLKCMFRIKRTIRCKSSEVDAY